MIESEVWLHEGQVVGLRTQNHYRIRQDIACHEKRVAPTLIVGGMASIIWSDV